MWAELTCGAVVEPVDAFITLASLEWGCVTFVRVVDTCWAVGSALDVYKVAGELVETCAAVAWTGYVCGAIV